MIKFFRKIRHQLLSKNKLNKYLIYALGEIALVVIGILIALQINNWNEKRKEHALENVYLKSIEKDLEATKKNLEIHLERHPIYLMKLDNTINYIGMDAKDLTQSMKDNIGNTGFYGTKVIREGLNALLSSGRLDLISDDSLKMSFTEYPSFVNAFEETMKGLKDIVINQQRIILERHYSLTDHLGDTNKFPNLKQRAIPSDFDALLKDRAYQNVLVKVRYHLLNTKTDAEQLLAKTSKILEKIEKETARY